MEIVIASGTTDLAQNGSFELRNLNESLSFVRIDGTSGAIDLEYWNGSAWDKAKDPDGTAVQLSANRPVVTVTDPILLRWNRDGVQAGSIGVGCYGPYASAKLDFEG